MSRLAAETLERMLRRAGKTIPLAKGQSPVRVPLVGPGSGTEETFDGEDRITFHDDDVHLMNDPNQSHVVDACVENRVQLWIVFFFHSVQGTQPFPVVALRFD